MMQAYNISSLRSPNTRHLGQYEMIRNRKSWNACVRVCDTKCVFLFLHLSFGRLPPSPADFIISHLGSAHFNSQNCVRLAQIFQMKWTTENGWCGGWNCCRWLLVKRWQQFEEKHITIFRFHIICRNYRITSEKKIDLVISMNSYVKQREY